MAASEMTPRPARRFGPQALAVAGVTAVAVPLLVTVVVHPHPGPFLAIPPTVGLAALVFLLVRGAGDARRLLLTTVAVSSVSAGATACWVADDQRARAGPWPLLQTVILMVLIVLVCRSGPVRAAIPVGGLGVLAEAALGVPVTGEVDAGYWNLLMVSGFWSLAGLFAAASGWYLRWLDAHRVRAVAHAHRTQRLQLATDLHDFVAHDVSAMVVRAQAAQVLLDADPQAVGRLLREIESDGTEALTSMDRTIQVLRDLESGPGVSRAPMPGAGDLPELVERFGRPDSGPVGLDLDSDLVAALPRETSATVYRIVVEALTNIRRHTAQGAEVTISLAQEGENVVLSIADQEPANVRPPIARGLAERRSGGTGLENLAQRVRALGGTFTAGPRPAGGWQIRAEFRIEDGRGRR